MYNTNEYITIETRAIKVNEENAKMDGRFLQGFVNGKVSDDLILEIIDNSIIEVDTYGNNTTVVKCTLPNGFVIVESSSCLNEAEYCEMYGFQLCMDRIFDKVKELLSFTYLTAMNGFNATEEPTKEETAPADDKLVDKAIEIALEQIIEKELNLDKKIIRETELYKKHKESLISNLGETIKKAIAELAVAEELSLEDLVEVVLGLYMAVQ